MHVQKPTMEADQLQIISREIGSTGKSFTGLTLARSNYICIFIQFKLVHIIYVMLLYPNDNLGAIQIVAPTCERICSHSFCKWPKSGVAE